MKKFGLVTLGIIAGIAALVNLGPLLGLGISALFVMAGVHFYLKSDSSLLKIFWATVGIIGLLTAISNIPGFVGILSIVALYFIWKTWNKEDLSLSLQKKMIHSLILKHSGTNLINKEETNMTSLLQRLKYSVKADLHQLFDKKEEKNPIAMLNQYIREAEKQTEQTGKWLERQGKLKQELEKELAETLQMAEKRKNQVELANASGEEDLISFAQAEVDAYNERATTLQTSIHQTMEELFGLERKYEEMKHKVKDMKVRQLQLMGKENVTRAHHQMDQLLKPEEKQKGFGTFQDMEQYIERLGQKIEKEHEITSMEQRLEQLEKNEQPKAEIV